MKTPAKIQPAADIKHRILTVRGEKVLLDADLARIYSVQTRVLNQAVRRNLGKFPDDFRFQLIQAKADQVLRLRSQFVTLKLGRGQHRKYLPYAFTEPGAIMAANVLNSPRAVRMSVFVMRAFVKMRELLGGTKDLARQLKTLEARLTARLDGRSWTCSSASCGSSTRRPNRRRPAARSASTSSPTTRPAALRKAGNDESRRLAAAPIQSAIRILQSALQRAGDSEFKAVEQEIQVCWLT